jgi:hypothetical protein
MCNFILTYREGSVSFSPYIWALEGPMDLSIFIDSVMICKKANMNSILLRLLKHYVIMYMSRIVIKSGFMVV